MSDTVVRRFIETAKRHPNRVALRFKQGQRWLELSWSEYYGLVSSLAAGLQASGIRKGDRVAVLAGTRLEWAALDLAILGLGAVTVPIYSSSTVEDIGFILHDSKAKFFFIENSSMLRKLESIFKAEVH